MFVHVVLITGTIPRVMNMWGGGGGDLAALGLGATRRKKGSMKAALHYL